MGLSIEKFFVIFVDFVFCGWYCGFVLYCREVLDVEILRMFFYFRNVRFLGIFYFNNVFKKMI